MGTDVYKRQDGQLNFDFTGMIIPENEWLYVQNGQVLTDYTGMALNDYGLSLIHI